MSDELVVGRIEQLTQFTGRKVGAGDGDTYVGCATCLVLRQQIEQRDALIRELAGALEYAQTLIKNSLDDGRTPRGFRAVEGGQGLGPIEEAIASARRQP